MPKCNLEVKGVNGSPEVCIRPTEWLEPRHKQRTDWEDTALVFEIKGPSPNPERQANGWVSTIGERLEATFQ